MSVTDQEQTHPFLYLHTRKDPVLIFLMNVFPTLPCLLKRWIFQLREEGLKDACVDETWMMGFDFLRNFCLFLNSKLSNRVLYWQVMYKSLFLWLILIFVWIWYWGQYYAPWSIISAQNLFKIVLKTFNRSYHAVFTWIWFKMRHFGDLKFLSWKFWHVKSWNFFADWKWLQRDRSFTQRFYIIHVLNRFSSTHSKFYLILENLLIIWWTFLTYDVQFFAWNVSWNPVFKSIYLKSWLRKRDFKKFCHISLTFKVAAISKTWGLTLSLHK